MPRRPTCSTSWLFLDASEILCRSIHRRCSVRKGIFRNFTEFRTPVPESLFFFMAQPATLLKKRLWHRCFPVSFAKFKNNVSTEHLWAIGSVFASFNGIQYCLSYLYSFCFILFNFIYLFVLLLYVIYVFFIFIYIFIYFINLFIYLFF